MDEKQKEIKTKSASGIWTWIFCLLFASAVILVVISMFGNYIRYVLTGKPDPGLVTAVTPEDGGPRGAVVALPRPDDRIDLEDRQKVNSSINWE